MSFALLRHLSRSLLTVATVAGVLFGENVPTDYVTYSKEELKIGDRAGTSGEGLIGSSSNIIVGSDAKVYGSLKAKGSITLYDRAAIYGDATTAGTLIKSQWGGAIVSGTVREHAQVTSYDIPARSVPVGSQDITVDNDKSKTLSPGNYRKVTVRDRATLTISNGIYNVQEFVIANDSKLKINIPQGGGVEVNASEVFRIGDRTTMSFTSDNNPTAVSFYSNGSSDMVVGYDCVAFGAFIAPNAKVIVHDRTSFSGTVYGKRVELQPTIFYVADNVFPTMGLSTPIAGSSINSATPEISIWYNDNKSGIDTRTFQVSINGIDRTSQFTVTTNGAIWKIPSNSALPEGTVTVVSYIEDRAGNAIENSATFTVDLTPPSVAIVSPVDNFLTKETSVTLVWSIDGVEKSETVTLANEGNNTITRSSTDIAGNTGTASITVRRDTQAPVVAIVSPVDNFLTNETSVTLVWSVDGIEQTETVSLTEEGNNTISRSATDEAGNTASAAITVRRDTQAPVVAIVSPVDNFLTKETSVTLVWSIDGVEQTETVSLTEEGNNTISRSATDEAGNTASASITVRRDTQAPVVAIVSPVDNFLTKETSVTLVWSIDGVEQTETVALTEEGNNTISRSATDEAGNTASAAITVRRDTQAPVVAIVSPVDNFLTKETSVALVWSIDGIEQTETVALTEEGLNIIFRSATDAAGNTGSAAVNVIRDTEAPVVAISSPANNFLTKETSVTLVWSIDGVEKTETVALTNEGNNTISRSATDEAGNTASAAITVRRDTQAPVVAIVSPVDNFLTKETSVTLVWSIDGVEKTETVALTEEGNNTISRSATDEAGNTASASITVRRDTQAPVVAIVSPVDNFLTKETSVTLVWSIDGVEKTETVALTNEGNNTISRSATDEASNTASAAITVRRDTEAPVVAIVSPVDNFLTKETSVTLVWSIDGVEQTETVSLTEEGNNTISRSATDEAGNTASASITVRRDTQAPVVAIVSPVDNFLTKETSVTLVWSIDGIEQTETVALTEEGLNIIFRSATDAAGNTGSAAVNVIRDTEAPVVAISSPANNFLTKETSVTLVWSIDGVEKTETVALTNEGNNTISRSATDKAGNTASAAITVRRDTQAPVVAIVSPVDNFLIKETSVTLVWSIDGVEKTETVALTEEGNNTISRSATDEAGNTASASITVRRDTQAPVVAIVSPVDNFLTKETSVTLVWSIDGIEQTETVALTEEGLNIIFRSATDAAGNTGSAAVNVIRDTEAPVVAISSPANNFLTKETSVTLVWSIDGVEKTETVALTNEGNNTISRSATDEAGNTASAAITVRRDTQAPVVAIVSPVDNFLTKETSVTLVWSIDGVEKTETVALTNEGNNTISRSATDEAGNTASAAITVRRDTQAPVVAIVSPVDNFLTKETSVTLVWSIDGVEKTETVALTNEGNNTISRSATDEAGNTASATINVIRDTQAPVVTISSPVNNFLTKETSVTLVWLVDGVEKTETVALTNEGNNSITRAATDEAGNTASATINVIRDTEAPTVVITSPMSGSWSKETSVSVVWLVDGVSYNEMVDLPLEGANIITRTATDEAGNSTSASITVKRDTQKPIVKITSPSTGYTTSLPNLPITWTVDGVVQTTQNTAVLSEGWNYVTRSAFDAAGNYGSFTISVNYNPTIAYYDFESGLSTWIPSNFNQIGLTRGENGPTKTATGMDRYWIEVDQNSSTYGTNLDCYLTNQAIALPAGGNFKLSMWTYVNTDDQGDGGFIELSTDGGTNYTKITPVGGYPGTIDGYGPGFTGRIGSINPVFDLSSYAGKTVKLRLHFVSNGYPVEPTMPSGLVSHYTFNEGTGTNVLDNRDTRNNLTLNGAQYAEWINSATGSSLKFNENNATNVSRWFPNQLGTIGSGDRTICAWFKSSMLRRNPDPVYQDQMGLNNIGGFGNNQSFANFQLGTQFDRFTVWSWRNDWTTNVLVFPYEDDQWHFAAVTLTNRVGDSKQWVHLYLDGVAKDSIQLPYFVWNTQANKIVIGNEIDIEAGGGGQPFNGSIDEFTIFNRSLSEAEINQLMSSGAAPTRRQGWLIDNISITNTTEPVTATLPAPLSASISDTEADGSLLDGGDDPNGSMCPVSVRTGAYHTSAIDIKLPGIGPECVIERRWTSSASVNSVFGKKWLFNFNRSIVASDTVASESYIIVRRPNGRIIKMVKDGNDYSFTGGYSYQFSVTATTSGWQLFDREDETTTEFNSSGLIVSVTDIYGRRLQYSYNETTGLLERITNASGNHFDISTNAEGLITAVTDNLGRTVSYTYSSSDLATVTYWNSSSLSYTYNSNGYLATETNRRGEQVISINYNDEGRVISYTERGETFTFNNNSKTNIATKTDSNDRTWSYGYNASGVRVLDIDPLGNTITRDPNPQTGLTGMNWIEDANGNKISNTFDLKGNRTSATSITGLTEKWTYDEHNKVSTYTDALGTTTMFLYNAKGELIQKTVAQGTESEQVWKYTYDSNGNKVSETDPSGSVATWTYDAHGNVSRYADVYGNVTTWSYDVFGNKLSKTGSNGETEIMTYNAMGNILSLSDTTGVIRMWQYDVDNNVIKETDAAGNSTQFIYDAWNRLIKKIDSENDTTIQNWIAVGDDNYLESIKDASGTWTYHTFDAAGRRIRTVVKVGDSAPEPDENDIVTLYTYDSAGNVIKVTKP